MTHNFTEDATGALLNTFNATAPDSARYGAGGFPVHFTVIWGSGGASLQLVEQLTGMDLETALGNASVAQPTRTYTVIWGS